MDFATLELIIDASQAEKATDKLDDLTEAGKRAEKSTDDLSGSTREYSGAASRAAEQAARQAAATTAGRVAMVGMTAATVAAVAATAVLIAAWRRRQEAMEEARKEVERINKSLDDLGERQRINAYGPGGEWVEPLRAANEELVRMQTEARGAWGEFKEIGSTIIQMTADADGLWDAIVKSFEESDTGRGLRNISAAIMDIDRLTGGRIAKQIELNRLQAIEEQQARVVAAQREIIAEKIAASEVVEERLRRQREAEIREAERAYQDEIDNLERGAELRLLSAEHVLRALEIERDQLKIVRDVNAALGDRITAQERVNQLAGITGGQATPTLAVPGGMTPGGSGGMILTPVTAHGTTTPWTFQGPTEEEIERLRDVAREFRALSSLAGDLAIELGGLSPVLADVLRGVEGLAAGASQAAYGMSQGGIAGGLNVFGAGTQIGVTLVDIFSGLFGGGGQDSAAQAEMIRGTERATEALREMTEAIRGVTEEERRRQAARDAVNVGGASALGWANTDMFGTFIDSAMKAGWTVDQMVDWLVQEHDVRAAQIPIIKDLIAAYIENIGAIDEWKRGIEEADAAESEARAAAEEAAKAQSIANFDVEISARRAALAGDDLTAMLIRGEAAIAKQEAEWQKLVESGHMTQEQLLALSDIMRDELAASIEAAADAARRASEDFMGMLHIEDLMASGDTTGAAIARAEQRAAKWIEQANDLDLTAEQYETAMETINRITRNTIDGILADAAGAGVAAFGSSIVDREAERAVVRSARSITSVQAETLADIGWSQLSVLQEIAVNTRGGVRGSDGVDGYGRPISTGPATVQNTGQQIHVHLHAGNIIGPDDVVGFVIDGVSRALGQEELDTATQDGSAFVP